MPVWLLVRCGASSRRHASEVVGRMNARRCGETAYVWTLNFTTVSDFESAVLSVHYHELAWLVPFDSFEASTWLQRCLERAVLSSFESSDRGKIPEKQERQSRLLQQCWRVKCCVEMCARLFEMTYAMDLLRLDAFDAGCDALGGR